MHQSMQKLHSNHIKPACFFCGRGWKSKVLDATWPVSEGPEGMEAALTRICNEAMQAIEDGHSYLIVSDRATGNYIFRGYIFTW